MSGIIGDACALAALDAPVQVIPTRLSGWRWATVTYLLVRRVCCRATEAWWFDLLCRKHIRIDTVGGADLGEHRH